MLRLFKRLVGLGSQPTVPVSPSFEADVKEFLIPRWSGTLSEFLKLHPKYEGWSIDSLERSLPSFARLEPTPPIPESTILYRYIPQNMLMFSETAFNNFLYRGEMSSIIELLPELERQGGVGNKKFAAAYVATHPFEVTRYCGFHGGVWIIERTVLEALPILNTQDKEIVLPASIPFDFVKRLLVAEHTRSQLLEKYSQPYANLFRRPLEEVVQVGFDERVGYSALFMRTVLELNLGRYSIEPTPK